MKTVNICVIGAGYWGPNIIRNLFLINNIKETHVFDIDDQKINAIKKKFPAIKTANNYLEILNNENINGIIIATPVKSHFDLAKKSLLSEKHTLVEKPMTLNKKQATELIRISKKTNTILMTGHTFVYSETIKKIKEQISKGNIGSLYYYDSTRINLGLIQSDVDVVWDLAPHDLSIINYLFRKKPISVQAFGSSFIGNKLEMANIFLRFQDNISAHIYVSWLSPVKIRRILIGGSKKMIAYDDIEPSEKIKIYDKGVIPSPSQITPFAPAYRSGDVLIPRLEQKEALLTELEHFVECIIKNKTPITSGKEGLEVVSILEAIDLAIKSKKEVKI